MHHVVSRRSALVFVSVMSVCAVTRDAAASSFSVNPTQIHLSAKAASALLTVKNESDDALRFQVTAFSWTQSAKGEMQLTPTEDVVFFPALLTLGAKEERKIRVGTTASFGATEKSYRIFVEELPPLERGGQPPEQTGVRVLMKMGVPVFLQPAKTDAKVALEQLAVQHGIFSFVLHNTGNTHLIPEQIRVTAVDAAGKKVLEEDLKGWYVLAGETRQYEVTVPPADCGKVDRFAVDVRISGTPLTQTLQAHGGACRP
jgi:fimbrial chaperone protein